ncbi:MAG: hypothetical protein ACREHD_11510, partial [Pirellulales bacterium]
YKLPIAGVKVYIIGHEYQAVYTDSDGRFTFNNVPTGDVKLVIDGTTVTDSGGTPLIDKAGGIYFPEMVMDLVDIKPGVVNTVMGNMGDAQQQAARAGVLGVYLPRLQTSILQPVSDTQVTHITADAAAAPDLTPQQRQYMSLDVQPGSLIGFDGKPVTNARIGIATVPPSLVNDMLPSGVLQHSFDITIQAPGVAVFTTPAVLTLPNVLGDAPGTQTPFLSFDHTTGRLLFEGTMTVSADGLYLRSDPGEGVTHAGWHSDAPPGGSAGPPPPPPQCQSAGAGSPSPAPMSDGMPVMPVSLPTPSSGPAMPASQLSTQQCIQQAEAVANAEKETLYQRIENDLNTVNELNAEIAQQEAQLTLLMDRLSVITDEINVDQQRLQNPNLTDAQRQIFNEAISQHQTDALVLDFSISSLQYSLSSENNARIAAYEKLFVDTITLPFLLLGIDDAEQKAIAACQCLNMGMPQAGGQSSPMGVQSASMAPMAMAADTTSDTVTQIEGLIDQYVSLLRPYAIAGTTPPADVAAQAQQLQDSAAALAGGDVAGYLAADILQQETTDANQGMPLWTALGDAPAYPIFYSATILDGAQQFEVRGMTGAYGQYSVFVGAGETLQSVSFYDPRTDEYGISFPFLSPDAPYSLPRPTLGAIDPSAPDSDGDGLVDLAEDVVGTDPHKYSTAGNGINDLAALQEGLNPLGNYPVNTGVVASLSLHGEAQAVTLAGSTVNPQQQIAYVATGSYGLAIVDASQFTKPMLLGQLALPGGDATSVSVDSNLLIAAVADGAGGLDMIDVSMPAQPQVLQSIAADATQVVAVDGIAYAAVGGELRSYDMITGDRLQVLSLGGGNLTSLAYDGAFLYT